MKRVFLFAGAIGWGVSILGVLLPWRIMNTILVNMGAAGPIADPHNIAALDRSFHRVADEVGAYRCNFADHRSVFLSIFSPKPLEIALQSCYFVYKGE